VTEAACVAATLNHGVALRSASSADLIVPATRRTTMGAGPRLRRRSTARLEQSARRDPSRRSPSFDTLKHSLKTHEFTRCFYLRCFDLSIAPVKRFLPPPIFRIMTKQLYITLRCITIWKESLSKVIVNDTVNFFS